MAGTLMIKDGNKKLVPTDQIKKHLKEDWTFVVNKGVRV